MKNCQDRLLHLHYCCYGNYRTMRKMYELDPSFKKIYSMSETDFVNYFQFPPKKAHELYKLLHSVNFTALKNHYDEKGIQFLTILDNAYPHLLKQIYDPPWVIYFYGNESLFSHPYLLSVVGTRHPSPYVYDELKRILIETIKEKVVIVSGMALGIDKMAHEISLENEGKTMAVLGYGLDYIYPKANEQLFMRLKEGHLLISEYPPYVSPQKWQFPERNRIISGLSQGTFVVEAKEKSGSLITADLALQQGRDVFALPGRMSHNESRGTNRLIQEGAKLVLSANDILEEYFSA